MHENSQVLALLVDFVNTLDVEHDSDVLANQRGFDDWSAARGLQPGSIDEARELRAAIRRAVAGEAGAPFTSPVTIAVGGDRGPRYLARTVVESVLAACVVVTITGGWDRLKLCQADDCREAFFDRSRNRSRVWCDMADCGNLSKVRNYRAAHS